MVAAILNLRSALIEPLNTLLHSGLHSSACIMSSEWLKWPQLERSSSSAGAHERAARRQTTARRARPHSIMVSTRVSYALLQSLDLSSILSGGTKTFLQWVCWSCLSRRIEALERRVRKPACHMQKVKRTSLAHVSVEGEPNRSSTRPLL